MLPEKGVKSAAGTAARRLAALAPSGVGELEDLRYGLRKYDKAILEQTSEYAKDQFLSEVENKKQGKGKIIPLDMFRSPYGLDRAA